MHKDLIDEKMYNLHLFRETGTLSLRSHRKAVYRLWVPCMVSVQVLLLIAQAKCVNAKFIVLSVWSESQGCFWKKYSVMGIFYRFYARGSASTLVAKKLGNIGVILVQYYTNIDQYFLATRVGRLSSSNCKTT